MRKIVLIALLAIFLFLSPTEEISVTSSYSEKYEPEDMVSRNDAIAEGSSDYSGTGDPLNVGYSGVATNKYDSSMTIDSTTNGITSVTVSDDWTRGDLDVTIDDLKVWMNNTARNWNLNNYHEEYFLRASSNRGTSVTVPDSWTLIKSITGSDTTHPSSGVYTVIDSGGTGYEGSRGWRFGTYWTTVPVLGSDDEIYFSQQISVPWRELYSAQIRLKYYVLSVSNLNDQVHLIVRLGGYEEKLHVFESGDTTNTWLTATVDVPSSQISTISMPNTLLLDVGLATDLSGTQPSTQSAYVFIDNIEVNFHARPFPEQIGLKVNGTAVIGSTPSSIYQYLPDEENRDCYDNTGGIDLDGYSDNGDLSVGYWSTTDWTDSDPFQVGLQFPVDIPQGAAITSAWVEVEPSAEGTICDMRVYVAGFDTTGQPIGSFTSGLPHLEDRYDWIGTSIDWDVIDWDSPVRIAQKTPDIGPLVQKIVSNSSWSNGNNITVMLDFMHSSYYQNYNDLKGSAYSIYASNELARLFVEYLVPLSEDTIHTLQYDKDITIDHTKVSGDLIDFPVLIDIIDTDLKTDVQPDGDDIAFMIGDQALDYEIELFDQAYSGSEAHLVAWVKVPYLSSTEDTVITMHYGNPNARSGSSTAVWDDYEVVHHMNDDPSGIQHDSTSNNHEGTSYGSLGPEDFVSGQIDGTVDFDSATTDVISIGQVNTDDWTQFTMSTWFYHDEAYDDRVFSKSYTTTSAQHILTLRIGITTLTVRLWTEGSGGGGGSYPSSNTTINTGQWYYVVWSWSASSGRVVAYVNGTPAIDVLHGGTDILDSIEVFVIGGNSLDTTPGQERFWDGRIDEARLTTMVLSKDWIDTEYANQLNPSSFYSVGSEIAVVDSERTSLLFTTGSSSPIDLNTTMLLSFTGTGQTLDENLADGTTFYATNDSIYVNWTAGVLISPPAETLSLDVIVEYPRAEWKPISVTNPIGVEKIEGSDWNYAGGNLTIYSNAIDVWGVWILKFVSWNYVQDVEIGISGQPLSTTATFNINDVMKVRAITPWITNAKVGLILTDPNDNEWHTDSNTTTGSTTHGVPSFRYRKDITIDKGQVDEDLTDFPLLIAINDTDLHDTNKVQSDGDDILFFANNTILDHDLVSFNQNINSTHAYLVAYVRTNLSATVDTTITMYYGNPVVGKQENPVGVWNNDYVGVWHMEETPAGTFGEIMDSTEYNNTGTTSGSMDGTDLIDAKIGKGLDFDEIDDLIYMNDSQSLDSVVSTGTIELWIWWDDPSDTAYQCIMESSNRFGIFGDGFEWAIQGDGDLYFYPWGGNGDNFNFATNPFIDKIWHHVAVTLDYNTKDVDFYLDGSVLPLTIEWVDGNWTQLASIDNWLWGGDPSQPGRWFDGIFDELKVSKTVRSSGWLSTQFNNQDDPYNFYSSIGTEQERTSPDHTFTKIVNSTFSAGLWTASIYYNDTGSSVNNRTGLFERNFIVKHDTSLTLVSPGDAVGDQLSVKIAGDMLYIVVELTDDVNAAYVNGSTVTMNWTIQGSPTVKTLADWGNGTYSITLNTTDLVNACRWRLAIESYHQFYNNATNYFDLDLSHETYITYETPPSTPYGDDFIVKITLWDAVNGTRYDGATITANRTIVGSPTDFGNGTYLVTLESNGFSLGAHNIQVNATPNQSYLEEATVIITFTYREIDTDLYSIGVEPTSVPWGQTVNTTLHWYDRDHGDQGIASGTVSGDSNPGDDPSFQVTDRGNGDYEIEIDVASYAPGTYLINFTLSRTNYQDANVTIAVVVVAHRTSVSVQPSPTSPWGYDTDVTVVFWDLDTNSAVPIANVSNIQFEPTGYATQNFGTYTPTLVTSNWDVGVVSTDITVTCASSNKFYDSASNTFDLTIRAHHTTVSVDSGPVTPWGHDTPIVVIFWDVDNNAAVPIANVTSNGISFDAGLLGTQTFSVYSITLDTDTWDVQLANIDLSVTCIDSNKYYDPASNSFDLIIRSHHTAVTVESSPITPWGFDSPVTVVFWDVDDNIAVPIENVTTNGISFDAGLLGTQTFSVYSVTLDTDTWDVQVVDVALTITCEGSNKYYDSASNSFDLTIRAHYTTVSVESQPVTPWGYDSPVTVVFWDVDNNEAVPIANVSTDGISFDAGVLGTQTFSLYSVTLDTDSWDVQVVNVDLSVTCVGSNKYYDTAANSFELTIRAHHTMVTAVVHDSTPFGWKTPVTVTFWDIDNDVPVPIANVTTMQYSTVSYGSQSPSPISYTPILNTKTWDVGVESTTITVTCADTNKYYNSASNSFDITIRAHHTTVTAVADSATPWGWDTTVTVTFWDTDNNTVVGLGYVDTIEFTASGYGSQVPTKSYTPTLDTDNWAMGVVSTSVTVTCTESNKYYDTASNSFDITIRAHHTTVTAVQDSVTPWGWTSLVAVTFWDTDNDVPIPLVNVSSITYTPSGETLPVQPAKSYNPTLLTSGWDVGVVSTDISLVADTFYDSAANSFDITIRAHHTTITAVVDDATPWGWDTDVTVTFWDVDDDEPVPIANITNIQFTPSGHSSQNFAIYTPTLVTNTWDVGAVLTGVSVTCADSDKYYDSVSNTFYITIRAHHTTVTAVAHSATPWGWNTDVTVTFWDTDDDVSIPIANVSSITYTPSGETLPSQPPLSYAPSLSTSGWDVGVVPTDFSVICIDSNKYYNSASNSFDITIRAHHTTVTAVTSGGTPWGWNTGVTVTFWDTDDNIPVPLANVSSIQYTPSGETLPSQPPLSYAPTLTTSGWDIGVVSTAISVTCVSTNKYYYAASNSFNITIRAHHTTVTTVISGYTPWGWNTGLKVVFWDVDNNVAVPLTNVSSIQYTPSGETLPFQPSLSYTPTLVTNAWDVGVVLADIAVTCVGSNAYYDASSNSFNITIRAHHTTVTAVVNSATPWGWNTDATVTFWDTDNNTAVPLANVSSIQYTPSGETLPSQPPLSYAPTLTTSGWDVGVVSTAISVTCSSTNKYYDAAINSFDITIRAHHTAVSVTGGMIVPYGNNTPVTVVFWDTDNNTQVPVQNVTTNGLSFNAGTYGIQEFDSSYQVTLISNTWVVGQASVVLTVTCVDTNAYYDSATHSFKVTIRALGTYLYHEPSDLRFPSGDNFSIVLRVNTSEPSNPYDGDPVLGLLEAEFSVPSYTFWWIDNSLGNGRYLLTINASYFGDDDYTITVKVQPNRVNQSDAQLVITFTFEPAQSFLSSPYYPQVTTPFETNVQIILNYTDVDRGFLGISGAEITAEGITIYGILEGDPGEYTLWLDVSGLAKGTHKFNISADAAGYQKRTLYDFTVLVRNAFTYAIPTVGALDIPVGNDPVFYVEYWDIDHDVPVLDASVNHDWEHSLIVSYISGEERYRVEFPTEETDPLRQNYVVNITFYKANYQNGTFSISVTIRTHTTDFRLVSAVEPTSYDGIINISVYYGDVDNNLGIDSDLYVYHRVENETQIVSSNLVNEHGGYYIIQIGASQFGGLGIQNFTIYFNWTGPVYTYRNKTIVASANIIGEESKLTLIASAEPTPYLENMSYTILFSEFYSMQGIKNTSNIKYGDGHVFIYVSFQGVSVDISKVDIWETNYTHYPGYYSIRFNTSIFASITTTGPIPMNLFINWSSTAEPFYTNRTDVISIRILPRDTLISVIPPSPTPWGENATFSFTYDDVTGGASEPIAYSETAMTITLSIGSYSLTYTDATKLFTVSFDTSQSPVGDEPVGPKSFTLGITWSGAPFYANRTGRTISITVTKRLTVVDFQSPAPTPYLNNVTFSVIWTDVTNGTSVGITGATVTLYNESTLLPSIYYKVTELPDGEYEIELNSTYRNHPGKYNLKVGLTTGLYYMPNINTTRSFTIQYRVTLLSSEPIGKVAYNKSINAILYYQDLLTLNNIANDSTAFIEIVNGTDWLFTCTWKPTFEYYEISIETYNQGLSINTPYSLRLNITYVDSSPYYRWDDVYISFELRSRYSKVELEIEPTSTPYLEYVNFIVLYTDVDGSIGIDSAEISIYKDAVPLIEDTDYLLFPLSAGLYSLSVNTTALNGLGLTSVKVYANWTLGAPYHNNATLNVGLTVTKRDANVEIVIQPAQTRYLENVSFTFAFVDSITNENIPLTKNLVQVYNHLTLLPSEDFSMKLSGGTNEYEISIDSTILSSTLVNNLNITVVVAPSLAPPFYDNDKTSTLVTIIARDTLLSIARPTNTQYGENATFTFSLIDITGGLSYTIANSSEMTIATNLTEIPTLLYNPSTRIFTMSFDTEQFADLGQHLLHLNVTWAGTPFYNNRTLRLIYVTVVTRQTQVEFESPAPTPFGDSVNFTISYLDIAGQTSVGIPDGILTLYNETGFVIPGSFYDVTEDGQGNWEVKFDTDYFNEPGLKYLNATFTYTGTYFSNDATSTRFINVRFRSTILSAEPVGQIGYATEMEVILYYQDLLTLANIGNLTSQTTFTITNDTGVPWVFTVQWQELTQNYLLHVEIAGQPLQLKQSYKLNVSISYVYDDPFYDSDWTYIEFFIRNRVTALELQDAPLPSSYLEFVEFKLYYWDADVVGGIALADIELETNRTLIKDNEYFFSDEGGGVYFIQVNTSALYGLGLAKIKTNAIWTKGPPYFNNATLNVTVSVIQRITNIEIVSPPGLTRYQDNVTFRMSVADITTGSGVNLPLNKEYILIKKEGVFLSSSDFSLYPTGLNNEYDISIDSTILTSTLKTIELTIIVNWTDVAPYYKDDTVLTNAIVTNRVGSVVTEPVADTPKHDNMIVNFTFADEDTGMGIEGATIRFYKITQGDMILGSDYWLVRGSGIDAGNYTILVNTTSLTAGGGIGTFTFTLKVEWFNVVPYYKSPIIRQIRGNVRKIQTSISNDPPSPSSVPIDDYVSVNVTFTDADHLIPILQAGNNITVRYKGGLEPQDWTWQAFPDGVYEITVRTIDAGSPGTKTLTISFDKYPYNAISIQVSFQLRNRHMGISVIKQESIYAGDPTFVIVNLTDADADDIPLQGATLTLIWNDESSYEEIIGQPGLYNVSLNTTTLNYGIKQLKITATISDFDDLTYTVDISLQQVTTQIELAKNEYEIYWGEFVQIYAAYRDTLHGNLIPGATVNYDWVGLPIQSLTGVGGNYTALLNTSQVTATTVVVTITASKINYRTAIAQITLSIKPLPVEVIPIAYDGRYAVSLPRGDKLNITVFLNDTFNNRIVTGSEVIAYWSFIHSDNSNLIELGNGYYQYFLDSIDGEAGKAYSVTITSAKQNYQGASTSITLSIIQTPTIVLLDSDTRENQDLTFNWSQFVRIGVNVYAPSFSGTDEYYQWNSSVTWVWEGEGGQFILDSQEEAHFYYILNTSILLPGAYTIRIIAEPEDKTYAISSTRFILSIQKIPTKVDGPAATSRVWGWSGWFYFNYTDIFHNIGVNNESYDSITSAKYKWADIEGEAVFCGDGCYGVFVNTTLLNARTSYTVTIEFTKKNHKNDFGIFTLSISEVPTEILVNSPSINRIEDSYRNLRVPIGDYVVVDLFYNDTDDSEGYVGGLFGAQISNNSYIRGPSIVGQLDASSISFEDDGNGHYLFIFDTSDSRINATDLETIAGIPYEIYLGLILNNRQTKYVIIRVEVIQIPAEVILKLDSPSISGIHGRNVPIPIFYNDTWHDEGISDATLNITIYPENVVSYSWKEIGGGNYEITLRLDIIQSTLVTVKIMRLNYQEAEFDLTVVVNPNDFDIMIENIVNTALPISLILFVLLALYVKVWSVPKRLRQINGQIKALSKGKIPKPIKEVSSRQKLVAALFNDTFSELEITRRADQMPSEAIEVDIPEMGELLMQLIILTKPTPEELDEFKADIAKMKLSEQAAFVKEVIYQEAIRAARRDGKTIDETLEWIRAEASRRLGAEAAPLPTIEKVPEEESIILMPEEELPEERPIEEVPEKVKPHVEEEVVAPPTDRLSQYELEELQKDLEKKGVPPHEIDTIMEQAKNLPRELVDELLKSLGVDKE